MNNYREGSTVGHRLTSSMSRSTNTFSYLQLSSDTSSEEEGQEEQEQEQDSGSESESNGLHYDELHISNDAKSKYQTKYSTGSQPFLSQSSKTTDSARTLSSRGPAYHNGPLTRSTSKFLSPYGANTPNFSRPTSPFGGSPQLPPWRKLLWLRQPYPDNYVDSTFLSQLKQNSHVQPYSFWSLSADFSPVLAHLCSVALFAIVFCGIYSRGWSPTVFAAASGVLTVVGYLFLWAREGGAVALVIGKEEENKKYVNELYFSAETLKSASLIVFTILALSPVLKSLTLSTSSDSIWALACWLLLANVLCQDYKGGSRPPPPACCFTSPEKTSDSHNTNIPNTIASSGSISPSSNTNTDFLAEEFRSSSLATNLAMAAAIVLASRLTTTIAVFSFILFSIELFGVFPMFVKRIRFSSASYHQCPACRPKPKHTTSFSVAVERYSKTYWTLLSVLVIATDVGLWHISGPLNDAESSSLVYRLLVLVAWVVIQVMVLFILPFWLLSLQKYKNEIQGPWDPAKPILQRRL